MLRSAKGLQGFSIGVIDGAIGRVDELFFDDQSWTIRYFVIDTSRWLMGRRVLISPLSIRETDWEDKRLRVALTKDQVEKSPGVDSQQPVSRQQEIEYYKYYGFPHYWSGPFRWGTASRPSGVISGTPADAKRDEPRPEGVIAGTLADADEEWPWWDLGGADAPDPHLRSTGEVFGYGIQATDGDIGEVEDLLVDDDAWAIRYVIVDTGTWLPGKKVLVSPEWIRSVDWRQSKVHSDLTRDAIRNGPEWDPSAVVDREYEDRLHAHYGRQGYWTGRRRAA